MDLLEWKQALKETKKAGYKLVIPLVLQVNACYFRLEKKDICKYCKAEKSLSVLVNFKEPVKALTYFEITTLFMVFALNKLPYDYAQFHKCEYGKKFIENIKSIKVIE